MTEQPADGRAVVVVTVLFDRWQGSSFAQAAIQGAVAAAVAITVKTCWTIAHPHFKVGARLRVILIGTSAFALHIFLPISAIDVLLLAAVVGFFLPQQRARYGSCQKGKGALQPPSQGLHRCR